MFDTIKQNNCHKKIKYHKRILSDANVNRIISPIQISAKHMPEILSDKDISMFGLNKIGEAVNEENEDTKGSIPKK